MKMQLMTRSIGAPINRIDGIQKATGAAKYAYEYPVEGVVYLFPVQSTIARGRISAIDVSAAQALPGVITVLSHENAPRLAHLANTELEVLQTDAVAYNGQFVAAVIAETSEIARQAAELVVVHYEELPHHVELRADDKTLYKPPSVNEGHDVPDRFVGDVESALASAAVSLDQTYTTPTEHNNPLETHATIALWDNAGLTIYDSNQGSHAIRDTIATAFSLLPERIHIVTQYVGGGFGSKLFAHPPIILTVMAAQVTKRPVKLALTRQQMFSQTGYRTPTIQRIRLGADNHGHLTAIAHDVIEQTSTSYEFAEQVAVVTRRMYAAPNRRTTHRVARLDMPVPTYMRGPGECPGMFALESAMDELAIACGMDPIELRIRNEPTIDPETGYPFSSRGLVACLQEGARRFGWQQRDPTPRMRQEGRWLIGTGVASSTYPAYYYPASASVQVDHRGMYQVHIDATDIGTGARTALTQIAADVLDAPLEQVQLEIGNSDQPAAGYAGGSSGTSSWGWAIFNAANALHTKLQEECGGVIPAEGLSARGTFDTNPELQQFAIHSFGAQFAEVHINVDTGEIRVPRLLGVFAAGKIVNPKTAHSQFMGGMTWGLSMALHEASVLDTRYGNYVNHDFGGYHISTNADVGTIDVVWLEEDDLHVNPLGTKGIGEIGIVGTAAAIANAAFHATGIRVRDLPITLDKFLS
ncbi:xanthine dehydrogenase family protein molybdopterin-binding subunit [Ktedonospora formicarum]|uniref:Xanthine dehydrogenase n=1 Tax=Ktedonospora formicarum TaxID=2778364 RepID=A0A8J3MNQ0_9CHLR|nr:xanthine dehydrogenase family protein molybdopterin-binding subunit [Ktedonospora formicarum]GHO42130.1 xanthine dehydrogenase [Ktedonospora formicarum]